MYIAALTRAPRLSSAPTAIAMALALQFGLCAHSAAIELATDNSDLRIRWDNTALRRASRAAKR